MRHIKHCSTKIESLDCTVSTSVAASLLQMSSSTIVRLCEQGILKYTRRVIIALPGERLIRVRDIVELALARNWELNLHQLPTEILQ